MKKIMAVSLIFMSALMANSVLAERVEVRSVGTYQYQGKFLDKKKPKDEETAAAVKSAKENAWKNFVAGLSESKQESITQHEGEMQVVFEKSIIDFVILDSYKDPSTKTLRVSVRVAFNDTAVSQYIQKLEVGANGAQGARSSDSLFSFVLVARKVIEVTQYNSKVTDVNQAESARNVAADGAVSRTNVDSSGGSQTQKEDRVMYKITSSRELGNAMMNSLQTSKLKVKSYADVEMDCGGTPLEIIQTEFVSSDELKTPTRKAVINSMRACGVRYFAYGTVDISTPSVDPSSGEKKVFAKVSLQVEDVSPEDPKQSTQLVGSIEATTVSGLGPDGSVASTKALNAAARNVTKSLVDILNAEGIR